MSWPRWLLPALLLTAGCSGAGKEAAAVVDVQARMAPASRLVTTPYPVAPPAGLTEVEDILERVVLEHATDELLPWGIAHGLLAIGGELRTRGGDDAIDFLYARIAQALVIPPDSKLPLPVFANDRLTEPHVDLILKNVLEIGVSLDRPIQGAWGKGTVRTHAEASLVRFDFSPATGLRSASHADDLPWSLQAFATVLDPEAPTWRNHAGTTIDLDQVTEWAAAKLGAECAALHRAHASGDVLVRNGEGILAYACGGAHFYQGVAYAVGRGFGEADAREAVTRETRLLFWRLDAELASYDRVAAKLPEGVTALDLAVQRLKFIGHWNESIHKTLILGLYEPSAEEKRTLRRGLDQLVDIVRRLEADRAFAQIPELKTGKLRDFNNALNLIGDASHALRGLRLATGQSGLIR